MARWIEIECGDKIFNCVWTYIHETNENFLFYLDSFSFAIVTMDTHLCRDRRKMPIKWLLQRPMLQKWKTLPNWMNRWRNKAPTHRRAIVIWERKVKNWGSHIPEADRKSKRNVTSISIYRIKPNHQHGKFQSEFKSRVNNIWSSGLQEDCLSETLKGCGVNKPEFDRNIESYDYSLKYRLNGENSMKRRQSNNSDDSGDRNSNRFEHGSQSKRFRASSMGSGLAGRDGKRIRKNVRLRLGHKSEDSSSNDGENRAVLLRSLKYLFATVSFRVYECAKINFGFK